MSYAEIFAETDAKYKAQIMYATWGHLDAAPGTVHKGSFLFIHGQHGDMATIESDFPTFGEGPGYFSDRQEFIWEQVKDNGPCSETGIYLFEGAYRRFKNGNTRFTGTIKRIDYSLNS
jgi:hypothetical protein